MERNSRKVYVGRVVSAKNDKTITVLVDELNTAKEGDIVEIMETRPLSATKRFRLVKIVQEAVII